MLFDLMEGSFFVALSITVAWFIYRAIMGSLFRWKLLHPSCFYPLLFEVFFVAPQAILPLLSLYYSPFAHLLFLSYALLLQLIFMRLKGVEFLCERSAAPNSYWIIFISLTSIYLLGVLHQIPSLSGGEALAEIANRNATDRYGGTLVVSPVYKIGVICAFSACVLGGWLVVTSKGRAQKIMCLSIFFVGLIDSVFMAARAGLMMMMVVYLAAYYTAARYLYEKRVSVGAIVLRLSLVVCLLFVFFVFVQYLRGGGRHDDVFALSSHVLTWFVGYLSAFGVWFDGITARNLLIGEFWGGRTFAGLYDILGFKEKTGGIYQPVLIGEGRMTNVFTGYRGLIEDFGLIASFVFISLSAWISVLCIRLASVWGGEALFAVNVLTLAWIGWSFVISILTYNSVLLGVVLGGVVVLQSKLRVERYGAFKTTV